MELFSKIGRGQTHPPLPFTGRQCKKVEIKGEIQPKSLNKGLVRPSVIGFEYEYLQLQFEAASIAFLKASADRSITSSSTQKASLKYPGRPKPRPGTASILCC